MPIETFTERSVICDKTAFKYYRTPPRYLGACPKLPGCNPRLHYSDLRSAPLVTEVLGLPIHILTANPNARSQGRTLRYHVISRELPPGSTRETPHGFSIASPELTLFTLSRTLTFNQLVMAMYEMCGRFSIFAPSDSLASELHIRGCDHLADGWSCVANEAGAQTSLWNRQPLTSVHSLQAFGAALGDMRGAKLFLKAVSCVSGITASPFEAQAAMLLWMDPALGGWGYRNIESNVSVTYDRRSKVLADSHHAEVDIRVTSPEGQREWMLECQGKIVHDRIGAGTKDAQRVTALQAMGHQVTMLTSDQIRDPQKFEVLLGMLSDNLGISWADKTGREILAENNLRADIFSDWLFLQNEPTETELLRRKLLNKKRRAAGGFPN
ncbi:MAG: hypothetical protein Q4B77_04950 [Coriobacteriaceae bacterium]|nr:hypothetical protein [Coriobacteriaceae bacterium]